MTLNERESGITELKALLNMANWTHGDAFEGLSLEEVISLLRACRKLDLETLPDMLTGPERREAAKTGIVPTRALRRMYKIEGLPEIGIDWEGR
jgi:hypothetical protein